MVFFAKRRNPRDRYMTTTVEINGRSIGAGHAPYIIAELSGNHNGDLKRALRLIENAAAAGADAVKLQTYTADTLTIDHSSEDFTISDGLWSGKTLYQLYQEASTPWEWHEALFEKSRELNLTIFSSPFDATAVDFLEELNCPAYKIASFEIVDLQLIEKVASTGKPLIISTGMADIAEIDDALAAARGAGATEILLLHCVSGYPTPPEDVNLLTIADMAKRFDVPVGLSDHTLSAAISVAAVALGAVAIEKHFTLKRSDGGPDAAFSLEGDELGDLVTACNRAWKGLGAPSYERAPSEQANTAFRRSLYVVADIAAGEVISEHNIRSIRPGYGLAPKHWRAVIGRKARFALKRGTPLSWDAVT